LDDSIYCIGGAIENNFKNSTNKIYRLNLQNTTLKWEKTVSMTEQRSYFGAAVCKECLVAVGGYTGKSISETIEVYDPRLNEVREIKSLNEKRFEHELVVADGKLFAIGGANSEDDCLSSVKQKNMDILGGRWKIIKPMNEKRKQFAAVLCNYCIYAIGGLFESGVLASVEKYDTNTNKWSFVSRMNVARWKHAACVLRGKIFVVGGIDQNDEVIKTIECYDPTINEWTIVGETKQELCGNALVAI